MSVDVPPNHNEGSKDPNGYHRKLLMVSSVQYHLQLGIIDAAGHSNRLRDAVRTCADALSAVSCRGVLSSLDSGSMRTSKLHMRMRFSRSS